MQEALEALGAVPQRAAWGTVREDYSADGDAWDYFPHDHARSRAYRWSEDGIAGICDDQQRLCFALALWNGRDPILKERLFGLTGSEGNHGEDVKEYYFYLDATPTHSYMKMLYKYPQARVPLRRLVEENRRRGRDEPEFELLDTGVFDEDRYFDVVVEYAKAGAGRHPHPHHRRATAARRRRRCTCCRRSGSATPGRGGRTHRDRGSRPAATERGSRCSTPCAIGTRHRSLSTAAAGSCCSPRTRPTPSGSSARPNARPYVKDAFHDCVVARPRRRGEPGAARHQGRGALPLDVPAGGAVRASAAARPHDLPRHRRFARFRRHLRPRRDRGRRVLRDGIAERRLTDARRVSARPTPG